LIKTIRNLFIGFAAMLVLTSFHQSGQWYHPQFHSCVRYEANHITASTNHYLYNFYKKLDAFTQKPEGKINIVHIGDSHIQADYLTEVTRKHFQYTFGNGGRGFVFPFRLARTNGPLDLRIYGKGDWISCRSIKSTDYCSFGLSGITLTTHQNNANVVIKNKPLGMDYSFNKAKLFYEESDRNFGLVFGDEYCRPEADEQPITAGYSEVYYTDYQDSFVMSFDASMKQQSRFALQGISLENDQPGILYHAIGTNGAYSKSYLRCEGLVKQLSHLNPDLVILSLGTNDGYMTSSRFCKNCFKSSYETLIDKVRQSNPNASILLTTPGDHFYRRRYHNRNIKPIVETIHDLAEEKGCAVWDFNKVMGGAYGIRKWNSAGLARRDLIHFTEEGYKLQGFLLYTAIMEGYEKQFD
jgi:lysophospholipase L1-like esterase